MNLGSGSEGEKAREREGGMEREKKRLTQIV
jgi:hypothetical protein